MVGHDNKIHEVLPDFNPEAPKEAKVVIIDADSLLYVVSYTGKDEITGEKKPEYTEEEYHIAEGYLTDHILKILSNIEEYFDILQCYVCVKGQNNFRMQVYSDYKSNRPPTPDIVRHLVNYLIREHHAIPAHGFEADDLVFSISDAIGHDGVICGYDKDLYQIPSVFYNYMKDEWKRVDDVSARHNLATQVLIGDCGDGVNFTKGIGPKTAQKLIQPGMSNYQYMKAILPVYKKLHGDGAREKMRMCYKLVKLHNVDTLDSGIGREKKTA